jgi:hypothetical protein
MGVREIAQVRVRYGYRKIRVLLNREGWKVGKKLVSEIARCLEAEIPVISRFAVPVLVPLLG